MSRRLQFAVNYGLLAALFAIHAALLAYSAVWQSPTLCEPGHLAGGLSIWQFGRFDVYRVNPPLVRTVAAAPVLLARPKTDWEHYTTNPTRRCELALGQAFFQANGPRSFWLLTFARWACIPFSLLGAWVCYAWARDLYGNVAGWLSAVLWCFCPNILGHGALITPDVGGTALGATAGYVFWRWLRRPDWRGAALAGFVLGLAELAKFTLLVFYPLWPLLWIVYRWNELRAMTWRARLRELAQLAVAVFFTLYLVNVGYLFEGSGQRLGEFRFQSRALTGLDENSLIQRHGGNRFAGTALGYVPVPLPRNFVQGIDTQKVDFELKLQSYWAGKWHPSGTWFYYLYGLGVKVPLGTLALAALAVTVQLLRMVKTAQKIWRERSPWRFAIRQKAHGVNCRNATEGVPYRSAHQSSWREELGLLAPAAIILVLVSSQTGMNSHFRYVLPIFPFCFIWIGKLGRLALATSPILPIADAATYPKRKRRLPHLAWRFALPVGAGLTVSILSSLLVYPHSLSYFNEAAGGPAANPPALLDSNISWGQDLHFAKRWLDRHPDARPLQMAAITLTDPRLAEIEFTWPGRRTRPSEELRQKNSILPEVPPGWYAIDVNLLGGATRLMPDGQGAFFFSSESTVDIRSFRHMRPVGRAGYSTYFYRVEPVAKQRLLGENSQ